MIKQIFVVLTMIAASFFIAVIYGNAIIYHGFPEMPNVFLSLLDHLSGESVYDLIYCNAFFCSVLLMAFFIHAKALPDNRCKKKQRNDQKQMIIIIDFSGKPDPMKIHFTTSVIEHELPTSW